MIMLRCGSRASVVVGAVVVGVATTRAASEAAVPRKMLRETILAI
jgi:hypothetical protein